MTTDPDAAPDAAAKVHGVLTVEQQRGSYCITVRYSETDADFLWLTPELWRQLTAEATARERQRAETAEAVALLAEDYVRDDVPQLIADAEAEATARERQRWVDGIGSVHRVEGGGEYCTDDGFHWPCRTARKVADLLDGDGDA